ncbi:MAG TPA: FAD-dependent oxidoreductase [Deltaproteobacteria bacterium]|nr:FAD-dependent oxidoreductase [Deltaproteobacteria bacterium]
MTKPRIVIVGAGFGGLAVARALRHAPVDVTVIDRHNYHAFLPLLYQVATSGLTAQDVAHPVRSILRSLPNARFRLGEVCGADLDARWVALQGGEHIPFDFLVLAAGSTTETWGNQSVADHALPLHDLEHALAVRNRALSCLERADATADPALREELLGFVVVGGGPTGVELAGALAELKRHVVPHDFPALEGAMRVWLLEGRSALLPSLPPRLQAKALLQVTGLGVEVRLGALVERVDPTGVWLRSGQRIPARTVVWAAGVRGEKLAEELGLASGQSGRIAVDETLAVPGHPGVYAIGDLALLKGAERLPQVAPVAIQQGQAVALNLLRTLRGHPPFPFRYHDKGSMATIGRNRAVALVFGWELSGRIAWWAWLLVHIVFLVGFRNRAAVLLNWAWNFFTYDRGLRAVVGGNPIPDLALQRSEKGDASVARC